MTCVVYYRMNGLKHKFHISADKNEKMHEHKYMWHKEGLKCKDF